MYDMKFLPADEHGPAAIFDPDTEDHGLRLCSDYDHDAKRFCKAWYVDDERIGSTDLMTLEQARAIASWTQRERHYA